MRDDAFTVIYLFNSLGKKLQHFCFLTYLVCSEYHGTIVRYMCFLGPSYMNLREHC